MPRRGRISECRSIPRPARTVATEAQTCALFVSGAFTSRHLTSAIQPAQNQDDSTRLRPLLPPTSPAAR
jgi:hypothetical protein